MDAAEQEEGAMRQHGGASSSSDPTGTSAVIEMSGVQWATEKAVVESVLGRRPGVLQVEANPVSQTATVTYDQQVTSVGELAGWVRDCGYHCRGLSVPEHICDPALEPTASPHGRHAEHAGEVGHPVGTGTVGGGDVGHPVASHAAEDAGGGGGGGHAGHWHGGPAGGAMGAE